jgi:hypothetical protein
MDLLLLLYVGRGWEVRSGETGGKTGEENRGKQEGGKQRKTRKTGTA